MQIDMRRIDPSLNVYFPSNWVFPGACPFSWSFSPLTAMSATKRSILRVPRGRCPTVSRILGYLGCARTQMGGRFCLGFLVVAVMQAPGVA